MPEPRLMDTATPVIEDPVWDAVRREAAASAADEPLLASFLHMTVLRHRTLEAVLSFSIGDILLSGYSLVLRILTDT